VYVRFFPLMCVKAAKGIARNWGDKATPKPGKVMY
jgi:hypothetical protein